MKKTSTPDKAIPMYYVSIEIENIKCFGEKQVLDLRDDNGNLSNWTLILGDNGVGKTTLLKCLAWMTPVEAPPIDATEEKELAGRVKIKPFMDDFENDAEYEQLAKVGDDVLCKITATFSNGLPLGSAATENNISHAIKFQVTKGALKTLEPEHGILKTFNTPNLFAYSASRHMAPRNFEKSELKDHIYNLFSDSADLYDAEQVLSSLEHASLKEKGTGRATDLLIKVKNILVDLLPDIENADCIILNSPINFDGSKNDTLVEIQTPYGKVPLYSLSLGYKTMLAWSVDLALRMLWRNPDSPNPLNEPAVVIVDEIDLHLHPKWQRSVRHHLTTHFPNTQFICTAHSPFMAQASAEENLCVLSQDGNEVLIDNSPLSVEGWRIGQIITSDLFGISSERSPEVESMINRRRELLDKNELSPEEKKELEILNQKLSALPVVENEDDQNLLEQIRKAADLLKSKGALND